jgi:hypothetical protein
MQDVTWAGRKPIERSWLAIGSGFRVGIGEEEVEEAEAEGEGSDSLVASEMTEGYFDISYQGVLEKYD